ncbi:hypothetical protein BV22DRAFT_695021 [Leucogyrophana mollusca]|uniref:Uncharacterized protein n=1 Tax=Leucogyrophana mollusca TaxID=85980 RepID=A0ACB8B8K6_9AGAM|nr:hypothetical protein BV22DRAFT_695021 [Leucogyrophana mollusca]
MARHIPGHPNLPTSPTRANTPATRVLRPASRRLLARILPESHQMILSTSGRGAVAPLWRPLQLQPRHTLPIAASPTRPSPIVASPTPISPIVASPIRPSPTPTSLTAASPTHPSPTPMSPTAASPIHLSPTPTSLIVASPTRQSRTLISLTAASPIHPSRTPMSPTAASPTRPSRTPTSPIVASPTRPSPIAVSLTVVSPTLDSQRCKPARLPPPTSSTMLVVRTLPRLLIPGLPITPIRRPQLTRATYEEHQVTTGGRKDPMNLRISLLTLNFSYHTRVFMSLCIIGFERYCHCDGP